jgi:hypothetical protein
MNELLKRIARRWIFLLLAVAGVVASARHGSRLRCVVIDVRRSRRI